MATQTERQGRGLTTRASSFSLKYSLRLSRVEGGSGRPGTVPDHFSSKELEPQGRPPKTTMLGIQAGYCRPNASSSTHKHKSPPPPDSRRVGLSTTTHFTTQHSSAVLFSIMVPLLQNHSRRCGNTCNTHRTSDSRDPHFPGILCRHTQVTLLQTLPNHG